MRPRLTSTLLQSQLAGSRGPKVFVVVDSAACSACMDYVRCLESMHDALDEWGARILITTLDRVPDLEQPAVIIADEWGEIFFQMQTVQHHELPGPAEIVEWARFIAIQCEECEQPEAGWREM